MLIRCFITQIITHSYQHLTKLEKHIKNIKNIKWVEALVVTNSILIIFLFFAVMCSRPKDDSLLLYDEDYELEESAVESKGVELLYGINRNDYEVITGVVRSGQTLSYLLEDYTTFAMIDRIAKAARPTFNFRSMRVGNHYAIFCEQDSVGLQLRHFIYVKNEIDYVIISVSAEGDISVKEEAKAVDIVRRQVTANIKSSLWNCVVDNDLPAMLSSHLEDIFGWSVDFFSVQPGDNFTVIYDERYIDDKLIGMGTVWGAVFKHNGKSYNAIPFVQDGKLTYWDEKGNSLRKQLLKAPLKFTRISSRFSHSRMHPIYRVRRPHLGVDYAAPSGTPVVAIADGTVTARYWDKKGGGNVIKLKHANNFKSSYLHLRGFARGLRKGKKVAQGEVIGYVGSTGASTGPHLDFRLYKGGRAIDPLKAPSEPVEPIRNINKEQFNAISTNVLAELSGGVIEEEMIDIYDLYTDKKRPAPSYADSVKVSVKENVIWNVLIN